MIIKSRISINRSKKDFTIQYFISSVKAGGQNRQKNATGVRIIDIKTGLKSECQDERSQKQNLKKAFISLAKKIIEHENQKYENENKIEIPKEVIRTYDFHKNKCRDKRVPNKIFDPYSIIDGNLDDIIKELL